MSAENCYRLPNRNPKLQVTKMRARYVADDDKDDTYKVEIVILGCEVAQKHGDAKIATSRRLRFAQIIPHKLIRARIYMPPLPFAV